MCWKVFYILALLLQFAVCYEIDENELEVPYEVLASDDRQEILPVVSDSNKPEHENVIQSDDLDKDSDEKGPEEEVVSFAGPVKAQGTVSVAANFGYNVPGYYGYPSYSMSPWIPFYTPHNFYTPLFTYPMPYTFPYISASPFFLTELRESLYLQNDLEKQQNKKPDMKSKNNPKKTQCEVDANKSEKLEDNLAKSENKEVRLGKNDFYLEVKPMNKVIENVPEDNVMENSVEVLSPKEMLAHPAPFLDEDFTDYDENDAFSDNLTDVDYKDQINRANDAEGKKETKPSDERMVFGGFVPASGTVRMAAKF